MCIALGVTTAPADAQSFYCSRPGKGHLLARINGAALEIYCVSCKTWEPVSVVDIVRGSLVNPQNGTEERAVR